MNKVNDRFGAVFARCIRLLVLLIMLPAILFPAGVMAAPDNCDEARLRDLGVAIINCTGDANACAPATGTQTLPAGSKIYVLGDSITHLAEAEVKQAITDKGFVVTGINAVSGRAISIDTTGGNLQTGLQAAADDAATIQTADAVVVALGTNSGTEDLNVQIPALVAKIREAKSSVIIYWVNLFYESGSSKDARNTTIGTQAAALGVTVINTTTANIPLSADLIHPAVPEGNQKFAQTVATGLSTNTGGGASGGTSPEVKPIVGGASLDGNPMHILSYPTGIDEQKAADAINVYIQTNAPNSPFNGLGSSFVTGGKLYNVNPFLPVGHLVQESSLLNNDNPNKSSWHNPRFLYKTRAAAEAKDASQLGAESFNAFGREGSSTQPRVYYVNGSGGIRTPFKWTSWAASLDGNNGTEDPWFALINRRYLAAEGSSFKIASGDFATYISHYAPGSDGNNEGGYVGTLKNVIDSITTLMGAGAVYTGPQGGGSVCGGNKAGAGGWGLPGEANAMIYYSQMRNGSAGNPRDPAVTSYWGDSPYGEGTIAECGCGPTSFAMIVATLTGDLTVTPATVAAWAAENGYRSGSEACSGSSWWWTGNPTETAEKWHVKSRQITIEEAPALLGQGKLIITSVGSGSPFLSRGGDGHLLVMRAVTTDGKFLFADPSDGVSKRNNGGDGSDPNIFKGPPAGSSHTPVDASIVSQGLKGLFVVETLSSTGTEGSN